MSTDIQTTGEGTPLVNTPADAPTIWVEGAQGAVMSDHAGKINFIEDFFDPSDNTMKRRTVLMLAMPRHQLKAVGELLVKMVADEPPSSDK